MAQTKYYGIDWTIRGLYSHAMTSIESERASLVHQHETCHCSSHTTLCQIPNQTEHSILLEEMSLFDSGQRALGRRVYLPVKALVLVKEETPLKKILYRYSTLAVYSQSPFPVKRLYLYISKSHAISLRLYIRAFSVRPEDRRSVSRAADRRRAYNP